MSLRRIGFNSLIAQAANVTATLMRVIEVSRATCKVHDGTAIHEARPLPAMERHSPIVVGDWATTTRDAHGALWLATRVPPYTEIARIAASGE